ncbi:MAG: penicillin-binding transpeptidase domain-containing protein, partial [Alphaproteobacteria bacterium]
LMEVTGAYSSFANGGKRVLPHIINRIRGKKGRKLYERRPDGDRRVIQPREAGMMNEMLNAVITAGTGHNAHLPGRPAAGKTGTTIRYRDARIVGYTADYVAGIWVGNDRDTQMKQVTGSSLPAEIWRAIMVKAHDGLPVRPLPGTHMAAPPQGGPLAAAMTAEDGQAPPVWSKRTNGRRHRPAR